MEVCIDILVLQLVPGETTALHCKVVCLIQLSKFEEALTIIKKNPKLNELVFEKAYCLYRTNNPVETLKTIQSVENLDNKLLELKAQVLYRLEYFEEAFDVYRKISKSFRDEYSDERDANMSAALVYAGSDKIVRFSLSICLLLTINSGTCLQLSVWVLISY